MRKMVKGLLRNPDWELKMDTVQKFLTVFCSGEKLLLCPSLFTPFLPIKWLCLKLFSSMARRSVVNGKGAERDGRENKISIDNHQSIDLDSINTKVWKVFDENICADELRTRINFFPLLPGIYSRTNHETVSIFHELYTTTISNTILCKYTTQPLLVSSEFPLNPSLWTNMKISGFSHNTWYRLHRLQTTVTWRIVCHLWRGL